MMERREPAGSYAPLLLAGFLGMSAGTAFVGRPSPSTPIPAVASDEKAVEPASGDLHGARPVLELLADHLDIPRHGPEVLHSAERLAEVLARGADATQGPEGLERTAKGRAALAARRIAERLSGEAAVDPLDADLAVLAAASLEKNSTAWEDRARVVEHFTEDEEDLELLSRVKDRLRTEGVELKIVIATLPDYVDSYSAWTFDLNLDALQRAAGALRYVMDRFYLPDWSAEGHAAGGQGKAAHRHGQEPGAVLFRKNASSKGGPARLLLALVGLETATAGVHKGAFLSAVRLARRFDGDGPLAVLGPTFSGSTTSLHRAFQTALEEHLISPPLPEQEAAVEVVSGSATLASNQDRLQKGYRCDPSEGRDCDRLVRFRSMTASDKDAMLALGDFLGGIDDGWKRGQRMAWLVESNTGWGQGLIPKTPEGSPNAAEGRTDEADCSDRPSFPCVKILPFPLHISRLRTTSSVREPPGVKTAAASGTVTSIRHEDATPFRDQLPSMRPELTSAMAETSLANILATLEHLGVTAVGLFGTDDRDKLFLAEQIRRRAPNVLIFTLDGSLAYLHADYRSYARGTVIVSSYPLFSLTQTLLPRNAAPTTRLQQFPTVAAEGVYNGLMALLGEPDQMLDYGQDCSKDSLESCHPSVWISVVGDDAVWPLLEKRLDPPAAPGFSWPGESRRRVAEASSSPQLVPAALVTGRATQEVAGSGGGPAARPVRARVRWPLSAVLLFIAAAVAFVLHLAIAFAVAWDTVPRTGGLARLGRGRVGAVGTWLSGLLGRHLSIFEPPDNCADRWNAPADPVRRTQLRQEYWLSLLACGGAVLAVVAMTSHLAAIGLNTGGENGPSPVRVAIAALFRLVLTAGFVAGAVAGLWPTASRRRAGWRPVTLVRWAAVGLGLTALGCLEWGFWARPWTGRLAGLNVLRYALMCNLVSPLLPVLLLSAIVYAWGLWNLWRLHQQAAPFGEDCAAARLLARDSKAEASELSRALDSPTLDVRRSAAFLLLVLAGLQTLVGHRFGATPDGLATGRLLVAGTMLATLLVGHTLAHCFHLGRTVLAVLEALNRHPIGQAFARLGRPPFLWRVSEGAPDARDVYPLQRLADAIALAVEEQARRLEPAALVSGGEVRVLALPNERSHDSDPEDGIDEPSRILGQAWRIRATDVLRLRILPGSAATGPREDTSRPLHATAAWRELKPWTESLRRALERGPWPRHPFPAADPRQDSPELEEAETLVALQMSCALRQLLVRLTTGLTFASTGLVLVLVAHLLYTFQGRTFWLGVDWVLLGLGTLVALYLFVRLERDAVLSRIWATRPDRLDWNGEFLRRILVYGAIPVVMLFVTFFPEVGTALFGWLEPVQKSLP